MSTKLPCSRCGELILPTTMVRTGGLCLPCYSNPEDKRSQRMRLESLPTLDLLKQLDEAVLQTIGAAASDAVNRLASERIYGFFLLHYIFSSCNAAVLTQVQFEKSLRMHEERPPGAPAGMLNRWSPVDSGHYFFREDLFAQVDDLFMALEGRQQEAEVARIFIRAMRHVRESIITDPRIVLSVMDYTEGPDVSFFAYAELFNDAATLARLREGLCPGPHWDYLDLERSRIPG